MSDSEMQSMGSETDNVDSGLGGNDIAIVGMACRLPGAKNTQQYWENLTNSREALTKLTDDELRAAGVSERLIENPNYVKAGMFLKDMECFDAAFFGFNPQEARIMDPQHRHFLECAWETFEDAGYVPSDVDGAVGVFAGSGHNAYMPYNLLPNKEVMDQSGFFLVRHTGNDKDFLSTRASYLFDLKGPSVNVQTACSTSLVAVHMAAQSLLSGECDMALAGGVTIELPHQQGYLYKDGEILSKDGHCRPFEQSSGGTLFGSGVGCVLLKRLDDALADGDNIHGILKSSAINNDGATKVSYLAPSVDGQVAAIREAIDIGDIDPQTVGFIECHGTGTQMGDPIEVAALSQAYGQDNSNKQYCALGSVKSNIGHLDTAAGVAGMIKAILSLKHAQLVPTLHFDAPNPAIDFASSPFYVNDRLREWNSETPRRAAVSSLGVGGTNAHIILEEPPAAEGETESKHNIHLLTLSAKTEPALNSAAKRLSNHLKDNPDISLADVAYTLNLGRLECNHRLTVEASTVEEAIEQLSDLNALTKAKTKVEGEPSLVFMLPGGGAQHSGMGAELYQSESVYRDAFDACMNCLPAEFSERVRSLVFAPEEERENATETLQTPTLTLTSLFATEYALAKQMMAWGAKPAAMIGHSMGENTAACLAGVMSLHDAMNLVYLRGQLFERAPEGGMLSIPLPLEEAKQYMSDSLDVAAVNSPELCVATGPKQELLALQQRLQEADIESTIVRIKVAAHSRMLDEILEDFRAYLKSIKLSVPSIPFTSNLTGDWISDEQAMDPNYWVDHLRNTVRFSDNVATVMRDEKRVFVEVGPGRTLTNLAMANLEPGTVARSSMRHPNEDASDSLVVKRTLGALWSSGAKIDWADYWEDEYRFRVALPTYAFEKKKHWVDVVEKSGEDLDEDLRKKKDLSEWYAKLAWRQHDLCGKPQEEDAEYLVFAEGSELSTALIKKLSALQLSCSTVKLASSYEESGDNRFDLSPSDESGFFKLASKTIDQSSKSLKVFYLWPMQGANHDKSSGVSTGIENRSFWGLFNLLKVLAETDRSVELCVVADELYSLIGETISPEKSLALGPVLVASRELPHVSTRIIDPSLDGINVEKSAEKLIRELMYDADFSQIMYRGGRRWVRDIDQMRLEGRVQHDNWISKSSTVLISGGLGGIGLNMARLCSSKGAKKVILMSRRKFPEEASWTGLLNQLPEHDFLHYQLSVLKELKASSTEVSLISADVTDAQSMAAALTAAGVSVDEIDAVIHAAGLMDDKLLLEKTEDEARRVLDAKVYGAKALDDLFAQTTLNHFIVFSSVASYLGLPGQIDYTAANAYLDAFAAERNKRCSGKTVAINWSAWKDVGMAVSAGQKNSGALPVEASLLDGCKMTEGQGARYFVELDVHKDWLVAEHKTRKGEYLVPGTGFVELIRSACSHYFSGAAGTERLDIKELNFMSAFDVSEDSARELNIQIEPEGETLAVSVYAEDESFPVVTASVDTTNKQATVFDKDKILARCKDHKILINNNVEQAFMDFGPRWACIDDISVGDNQALVSCSLPERFRADFERCGLHPSTLDMAVGCGQFLFKDFSWESDFYAPVGYETIAVLGQMPPAFCSHIRLREESRDGELHFDITLADENSKVFAEITNFKMQKLVGGFASSLPAESNEVDEAKTPEQERLEAILREAIVPEEGIEAFDRFMSVVDEESQCVIASIDTALWQRQLKAQFSQAPLEIDPENNEPVHDADADPDIKIVEEKMLENKGVESVVVRSFLDEEGDRRMIAYYIPDDWERVTVTELRNEIGGKLEGDLVPQQFVQLDEFPKGEDDHIDKTLLLDPFAPVDHYIAPRTPTEKKLAKIWQGILGVSRVGLNENFFDLGGHSLLSIRVIVKVKKDFGVRLDQAKMVLLTLEQMAKEIEDNTSPADAQPVANAAVSKRDRNTSSEPVVSSTEPVVKASEEAKKGLFSSLFKKGKR